VFEGSIPFAEEVLYWHVSHNLNLLNNARRVSLFALALLQATLLLATGTNVLFAQSISSPGWSPNARAVGGPPAPKMFLFDLLQFQSDPLPSGLPASADSLRLDVYIAVPYSSLSFVYAVEKYVADYAVILQVTDMANTTAGLGGKLVVDKYQSYNLTKPASSYKVPGQHEVERADASQYSLTLAKDHDYEIRIAIRDLANQHELDTTIRYRTRTFSPMGSSMSDLMIYRSRKGNRILPNIGPDISSLPQDESGIFAELYYVPKATYGVLVRLTNPPNSRSDMKAGELGRWSSPFLASGEKRMPVFQDLSLPEVPSGEYTLEFYLFSHPADTSLTDVDQLRSRAALYASRRVTIELGRGMPIAGADVDEAIDQVDLISTSAESDSLRAAKTLPEKRKALADFWRRRNPDPGSHENRAMQVFYRRVQYANETFSNPMHGWRSDRGRTYIVLGAPTTVDRHPYEVNQKPYEIWYYNDLNTRYVFVDEYMLGDYRLASAPAPTGMFLWQRDSY